MTGLLLGAGLGAVALGGLLNVWHRTFFAGLWLQVAGAAAVALAGFWVLASGATLGEAFSSSFDLSFGVDGLSGFFLGILGLIAAPAIVFSVRYLRPSPHGRAVGALTALFVLALALVACARDPLTFLFGWESMTLVPAAIILVSRRADRRSRQTVFNYLAVTHLGGVGTWIAILLLAHAGAVGGHTTIASGSGLQIAIALSALVGMGTKAGVMPLHVWLPRAHPIAPAPVSALMSGVMLKVALYGLVRVLVDWDGVLPIWFGVLVLAVGALSAVGGVVYALFEHDLKRLLALHSIENVGIIVLGIGACLVLRARGADTWAAFALAAALLHCLNHAVFKALLFLGAGAFERAAGSLEIDRLGACSGACRGSGGAFLVGAMAIAGLPPLNGFASEWLTLQALLHVTRYGHLGDGLAGALALAALAATAALAVFCFVKVVGLALLGPPRTPAVAAAEEPQLPMRAAVAFLALACVVLGFAPGLLFVHLAGLAPVPRRPADVARPAPAGNRLAAHRRHRDRARRHHHRARARTRESPRGGRADLGLRAARRARAPLDERGIHEVAAARPRGRAAPGARDLLEDRGRRTAGSRVQRQRPAPDRGSAVPAAPSGSRSAPRCTRDGCRAAASARTSSI